MRDDIEHAQKGKPFMDERERAGKKQRREEKQVPTSHPSFLHHHQKKFTCMYAVFSSYESMWDE